MDTRRIFIFAVLLFAGGVATNANAQGYSALTADIHYHGGDDGIPAGSRGGFRITIDNGGPDFSTNTRVWIAWFRSPAFGSTVGHAYDAQPSQGMCSPVYTPNPDCYLGMIAPGRNVPIEVQGETAAGRLGWYTLRVWVESDTAGKTMLAEHSVGSSVTIAESGGGTLGLASLLVLLLVGAGRKWSGRTESNRHLWLGKPR